MLPSRPYEPFDVFLLQLSLGLLPEVLAAPSFGHCLNLCPCAESIALALSRCSDSLVT
jgi:hypothetical protein